MRNAVLPPMPVCPMPARPMEDGMITAADIEIWARVERALAGKAMAWRERSIPVRKATR